MDQRSVKEIIGDDPVTFADEIMAEYPEELWLHKTRETLRKKMEGIGE